MKSNRQLQHAIREMFSLIPLSSAPLRPGEYIKRMLKRYPELKDLKAEHINQNQMNPSTGNSTRQPHAD